MEHEIRHRCLNGVLWKSFVHTGIANVIVDKVDSDTHS